MSRPRNVYTQWNSKKTAMTIKIKMKRNGRLRESLMKELQRMVPASNIWSNEKRRSGGKERELIEPTSLRLDWLGSSRRIVDLRRTADQESAASGNGQSTQGVNKVVVKIFCARQTHCIVASQGTFFFKRIYQALSETVAELHFLVSLILLRNAHFDKIRCSPVSGRACNELEVNVCSLRYCSSKSSGKYSAR